MDFQTYQQAAKRTAKLPQDAGPSAHKQRLANFGMGLSGEAGEVTDYLKKVVFHDHDLDTQKLKEELGDVLWYCAMLAEVAGLTLDGVAQANVAKLARRYPAGFSADRSRQRNPEAETTQGLLYLSGPMSGVADNNFPAFFAAETALREAGYAVVNPAVSDMAPESPWEAFLRDDLRKMLGCDGVVVLPGWDQSQGARLEVYVANQVGIPVSELAELVPVVREEANP